MLSDRRATHLYGAGNYVRERGERMQGHFRADDIGPNEPPVDVPDDEMVAVLLAENEQLSVELARVRAERDMLGAWILNDNETVELVTLVEAYDADWFAPVRDRAAADLAEHDRRSTGPNRPTGSAPA